MRIDITEQGAVGDGKSVNTEAIQKAVNLCHENGGGTVVIPGGVFISGTFFLKSNVILEVTAGAVLQASEKIEDYREDVYHNRYRNEMSLDRCFIYAQDQENIRIMGNGPDGIEGPGRQVEKIRRAYRLSRQEDRLQHSTPEGPHKWYGTCYDFVKKML